VIPRLSPSFEFSDLVALLKGLIRKDGGEIFETAFAEYTGKRHALVFPYGRSGLYTLIKVMGWRDREIIMPAFTCAVVPNVVIASQNKPCFVDVEVHDFNMSPQAVGAAVGRETAAVIVTHMYGFPMDIVGLGKALEKHKDVVVIQDCALALGSFSAGTPVWDTGLAALFSFSIGKQISSVEGGMIVTDDDHLYAEMKTLRDRAFQTPGVVRAFRQSIFFLSSWLAFTSWFYRPIHFLAEQTVALNFLTDYYSQDRVRLPDNLMEKLPSCLGYLGAYQTSRIKELLTRRIDISRTYERELRGEPEFHWPNPGDGASYSHCPCLVDGRDDFLDHMTHHGIEIGKEVFDYALPDIPVFASYAQGAYPNVREIVSRLTLFPNHPHLTQRDVERTIATARRWRDT
jgi:dTDP-4-amino-4,6-dideoxygalactose transaminase